MSLTYSEQREYAGLVERANSFWHHLSNDEKKRLAVLHSKKSETCHTGTPLHESHVSSLVGLGLLAGAAYAVSSSHSHSSDDDSSSSSSSDYSSSSSSSSDSSSSYSSSSDSGSSFDGGGSSSDF